jgi:parallel beta-helix repeat protein
MGNEVAGMVYENVTIENNVIYNSHIHGITVGETIGLTIDHNTILKNPDSAPENNSMYTPAINLADTSKNVLVTKNILPFLADSQVFSSSTSEHTFSDNLFVHSIKAHGVNYVGDLFVNALAGSTATLSDLKAVEDSIVSRRNFGAPLTNSSVGEWPRPKGHPFRDECSNH